MSVPQSLPSFAQAFSNSSLSESSPISNALPPIQSHSPPATTAKKRSRDDHTRAVDPAPDPTVRIKEEDKDDPPVRASSATPLSKKRRVTPIPISPAIAAFPLPDDPRPKKTPLDQRRASIPAAVVPPQPRMGRVSPKVVSRCAGNALASSSHATQSSPPPIVAQQPPAQNTADTAAQHSLPPPPISFARRRAAQSGGRKRKPADILISPRSAGPSDPLAPVIQSAPPVADPGRFPMAIPRLPLALNNAQTTRRVATNVPPTPTRFSLHTTSAPSISSTARSIQSPPNFPVPIASTLVPPTPHALHHPGYTGDKSAFLAPFEVFYDALNDSKQLKGWLSEQLQKSNALMISLRQQQDKMDETVEDLVEKRTRVMREEITMLRQRVESLEEALLAVRAESAAYGYPQAAKLHQNGAPLGAEPYRFPAPEQHAIIRVTSPGREQDHQPSLSPPVEVTRRPSLSTTVAPQALHSPFTLGHARAVSGSVKGAPPVRSTSVRSTESRSAPRTYYPGSYANSSTLPVEGRSGDKS